MDIIERAEQWLASIDETRLFDGEGAEPLKEGPELVRALLAALFQQSLATDIATYEVTWKFNKDGTISIKLPPKGINDAWPGNPGEGD